MWLRKIVVLLLFLCVILKAVKAQTYNFRVYGEDEGLAQSYVYSITQTKAGFLNVSTGKGFCSFEGSRFKTFTIQDDLAEDFVATHYTDSRSITWLGHYQKGITYLKNSKFYKINESLKLSSKVMGFAEDKEKNIWVATQSKGVFKISSSFDFIPIKTFGDNNSNVICFDNKNELLSGTNTGVDVYFVINKANGLKFNYCIPGFENKVVKNIVHMNKEKDAFWVSVEDEGIYGIRKNGERYGIFIKISSQLELKDYNFSSLFTDDKENLWIGDFGEGVRKISFSDKNNKHSYTVNIIDSKNGLPNEYIQSVFQDYEGNMWFGSFGSGLIELPLEKFSFFGEKNGLVYKNASCIFIDKEGLFWEGNDKGLFQFNIKNPELSKQYNAANGFITEEVSTIVQDNSGLLWIGTKEHGVFTYDKKINCFKNFTKEHKLDIKNINSIIITKKNNVVISTTAGVYFFDPIKATVNLITTLDGLLHNNVAKVFEDNKDRLWFCSNGAGPYFLKDNEFNVFNDIPELKSFNITALTQSGSGAIWIGTEGDGIYSYDAKGFHNYKMSDGLFSNYCYFLISDKDGNLWVGHKNGLSYKPIGSKSFRSYTKADGLLFTDFNKNSCVIDLNGNLWFGTANGLVKYKVSGDLKQAEPKTSIAGVAMNNEYYLPNERIDLPYADYSVKVDYVSISFTDPSKINFKYRLLGHDTLWRYTNSKSMEFPKLNDGEYTFQLLAANSDNVWNSSPAQIYFVVRSPYWKKVWFYAILSMLTISFSYSVTRYRTRALIQSKIWLEKKVNEKTALLKNEKEIVEKIRMELEIKNKNVTDSINYAQKIQASILPTTSSISEVFNKSFVFYKPRDIVSGDFYWFSKTADSYLIAAVDCTGHGVPGAFMSLVGSTLLNELVSNKKVSKPSSLLSKLNSAIITVLRQKADSSSLHDGMDMAICSINKTQDKLTFSGALRPLYHVRDKCLTEIKGSPYFIGGYYEDLHKTFKDTEQQILPGDMIYIFSDGYVDQFSDGANQKKFSTKRFKALLTDIADKDIEEQKQLLEETFVKWKGKEDQVDDVLIVGIKF